MIKILMVCHGNICRSPMAEFVMKDIVKKAGAESRYEIASAATTYEEIGNPVYPPARAKLAEHGIGCEGKTARHIIRDDYSRYDLIIGMDPENMEDMLAYFGGDPDGKLKNLSDYAGNIGGVIADPWYTRNFERTWQDVLAGCEGLFRALEGGEEITLDFSSAENRGDLFTEMRQKMEWKDWYGNNLDALYDILTGLEHRGSRFIIEMPREDSGAYSTAVKILRVFSDAGVSFRTE